MIIKKQEKTGFLYINIRQVPIQKIYKQAHDGLSYYKVNRFKKKPMNQSTHECKKGLRTKKYTINF